MTTGFWIARIVARGAGKQDATVDFHPGLNVVSGASDTGKSYLLGCIEYMFGGETPPKSVPEDNGYDTLYLELVPRLDEVPITISRSLKQGGDFNLFRCGLSEIDSQNPEVLHGTHQKGRKDTLPDILLDYSGIPNVEVRKSAGGTKRRLTFSDLRHFSLIDETAIISERSPVWPTGQFVAATAEKSVFEYLISGEDASAVVKAPDAKVVQAGWSAKFELLNELIGVAEGDVGTVNAEIDEQLEKLQVSIDAIAVDVAAQNDEINTLLAERAQYWEAIREARGRLAVIDQLGRRFELLRKHYESDLERLSFLGEADHYLEQLGNGNCPTCGQPTESYVENFTESEQEAMNVRMAVRSESAKLESAILDLASTMSSLEMESGRLNATIEGAEDALKLISRRVQESLDPQISKAKEEMAFLFRLKAELEGQKVRQQQLTKLQDQKNQLGTKPTRKAIQGETQATLTAGVLKARRQFCDELEKRLRAWKFPNVGTVEFVAGKKTDELVINGQPAISHGKGLRAIIHSAFTITLMFESLDRHSGIVVLDSPLTSFKDKDRVEVGGEIQLAVYEDLCNLDLTVQVIVLENRDPPEHLRDKMKYHHFSGTVSLPRAGFFPADDQQRHNS